MLNRQAGSDLDDFIVGALVNPCCPLTSSKCHLHTCCPRSLKTLEIHTIRYEV